MRLLRRQILAVLLVLFAPSCRSWLAGQGSGLRYHAPFSRTVGRGQVTLRDVMGLFSTALVSMNLPRMVISA
jgi:hypothetical protein